MNLHKARDLIRVRLPPASRWWIFQTPLDWDFSEARFPFQPGNTLDVHPAPEPEWADLRIFGMFDYAEGGGAMPWIGLRDSDGSVCGLDVEMEDPIATYNSTLGQFIDTFRLFDQCFSQREENLPLDNLRAVATSIDPDAFEHSNWDSLLALFEEGMEE